MNRYDPEPFTTETTNVHHFGVPAHSRDRHDSCASVTCRRAAASVGATSPACRSGIHVICRNNSGCSQGHRHHAHNAAPTGRARSRHSPEIGNSPPCGTKRAPKTVAGTAARSPPRTIHLRAHDAGDIGRAVLTMVVFFVHAFFLAHVLVARKMTFGRAVITTNLPGWRARPRAAQAMF